MTVQVSAGTLRKYAFRKSAFRLGGSETEWRLIPDGEKTSFKPIKGTWVKPIHPQMPADWKALISCPNCGGVLALDATFRISNREGRVLTPVNCSHNCGFDCEATLNEFSDCALYACAVVIDGQAGFKYMHAKDALECRNRLKMHGYKNLTIVDIGLCLGYYQEDRDGKVLSTN